LQAFAQTNGGITRKSSQHSILHPKNPKVFLGRIGG
jgi:hypothetical protein